MIAEAKTSRPLAIHKAQSLSHVHIPQHPCQSFLGAAILENGGFRYACVYKTCIVRQQIIFAGFALSLHNVLKITRIHTVLCLKMVRYFNRNAVFNIQIKLAYKYCHASKPKYTHNVADGKITV